MAEDAAMIEQHATEQNLPHWLKSDLLILIVAIAIMVVGVLECLS
jgi:hypothetical protein